MNSADWLDVAALSDVGQGLDLGLDVGGVDFHPAE